jgi:hypothetical protein
MAGGGRGRVKSGSTALHPRPPRPPHAFVCFCSSRQHSHGRCALQRHRHAIFTRVHVASFLSSEQLASVLPCRRLWNEHGVRLHSPLPLDFTQSQCAGRHGGRVPGTEEQRCFADYYFCAGLNDPWCKGCARHLSARPGYADALCSLSGRFVVVRVSAVVARLRIGTSYFRSSMRAGFFDARLPAFFYP